MRAMSIPKEQVIELRDGPVLAKKVILKSDHFPGCQNKHTSPQLEGAPNYRQVKSGPFSLGPVHVHGVASSTTTGIRNVLSYIGAKALWISLMDEPVVYINGRPFVLRNVEKPFTNVDHTGINRVGVEKLEAQLKEDILMEASRYGNKILFTDELPDGQIVDQWEAVSTDSVMTLLEVYEKLQAEGYLVEYERVPLTDGKTTQEAEFDTLIKKISQADVNMEIIFNCEMGCGRTTTGMVIATLIYFKRTGASDQRFPRNNFSGKISKAGENITANLPDSEEAIRRGEYAVVRSLIRVLEGGLEGKRLVDKVIDKCESVQNIRDTIATYRRSILHQLDERNKEAALSVFVEYLERYYFLICFTVYLHSESTSLQSVTLGHVSFADWMRSRPELYSILRRLLRRDPMAALGYKAMNSSLEKIAKSADGRPNEMSVIAAHRSGAVLGSKTVLKSDHSPGSHFLGLRERVEGAPNFREIPGFLVYGVANPTIDGIQSIIKWIWSSRGFRPVFWHNMREEPVIYINGKPFVIREVERAYKNMLEYKRTNRNSVEGAEARLKEDILREAKQYEDAIMVTHEAQDGQIFYSWEHVDDASVKTSLELYNCLEADGYPIEYARVPITDSKAPKFSDFDTLTSNIASASKDTAFVFNCQMGRGRTTSGTIIACLVKLRINHGRPIKVLYDCPIYPIVYDDTTCGGEETGSNKEEHCRAFGMDDILPLSTINTIFDKGVECREALDALIDRCSALQNVREAILQYRRIFNSQNVHPRVRAAALTRGSECLENYIQLIAFAEYLGNESLDKFFVKGESKTTFKNWMHQRPEVKTVRRSIRLRPEQFFTISQEVKHRDAEGSIHLQINEEGGDSSDVNAYQNCKDDSVEFVAKMDKISSLPTDIICRIVGFLSAKEAVRISILSKRFQNLFTLIPALEFDKSLDDLGGFLDKVLSLPELSTRLRKFALKSEEAIDYIQINNCVRHVLKLGVVDFELSISEDGYTLPLEVFTCNTIIKLKLGTGFAIDVIPTNALLPTLESLILQSVRFSSIEDCAFQRLLNASPVLTELVIDGFYRESWDWSGTFCSQSLQKLCICREFSGDFDGPHHQSLCFDTPNVTYLEYTDFVPQTYTTVNFGSLVEAKLDLHMVVNPQWDVRSPHYADLYNSNPAKLMSGIKNVKILELSSSFVFEALNFSRKGIPVFEILNHLTLHPEDSSFCWEFFPFFLKKTPNLETLVIKGGLHCGEEPDYICRCLSGYFCLSSLKLQFMEITLEDSGTIAELEQVKNFLGKLSFLKELKIHSSKKLSTKFVKDLQMLPRADAYADTSCATLRVKSAVFL